MHACLWARVLSALLTHTFLSSPHNQDVARAADELVKKAHDRGSGDNISVVLIALNQQWVQRGQRRCVVS